MFACKHEKFLCRDYTFGDTFESTHVNKSTVQAGIAANAAETFKQTIYGFPTYHYQSEAVTIETAAPYSDEKKIVRNPPEKSFLC